MKSPRAIYLCSLITTVTAAGFGSAHGGTMVIYPTGTQPADVRNVQAALNTGGSILLKATDRAGHPLAFNFGQFNASINFPPDSSVSLVKDTVVSGERVGTYRTTISGGVAPFQESTPVKATITGLKFDRPQLAAIIISGSNGVAITNNEVSQVLPFLNGAGFTESNGIELFGGSSTAALSTVVGQASISGNYVHGLDGAFEFGIQIDGVAASLVISDNVFEVGQATDVDAGSIDSEGIAIVRSPGSVLISGNKITVGVGTVFDPIALYGPSTGAFTIIDNQVTIPQQANCFDGIGAFGPAGSIRILENLVNTQCPEVDGIVLSGASYNGGAVDGALVSGNVVSIHNSSYGAISLYGAVTNCNIDFNIITGDAGYALDGSSDGTPTDLVESNSFVGNLISQFKASVATIFLDVNTEDNVVRGPYASVIDDGTGNQVSHLIPH